MSSDKHGFWGFFRRKEKKAPSFVEYLGLERMPEMKEKAEKTSPEADGQASLDELFVDWDASRALEKDLKTVLRWDEEVAPEPSLPSEPSEPAELLIEFPPLLEEEELAQLVERQAVGDTEEGSAQELSLGGTLGKPTISEETATAAGALQEIGRLVAALEEQVTERLVVAHAKG